MKAWILIILGFFVFWIAWHIFWRVTWAIGEVSRNPFLPFLLYGAGIYWWVSRRKRSN